MADGSNDNTHPNLAGLRIGPNGRPLTQSGMEFSPITPARRILTDDQEETMTEEELQQHREKVALDSYTEYMRQFERNKQDAQALAETEGDEAASGSGQGSYAAAAATPPTRPHWIFQTVYAKQPMNTATYLELRSFLKKALLATHCAADNAGIDDESINFTPLNLDQTQRGFPVLLPNAASETWLKKVLTTTRIRDITFRLWLPGEEPKEHLMSIYLNTDFDGVDMPLLIRTIKYPFLNLPFQTLPKILVFNTIAAKQDAHTFTYANFHTPYPMINIRSILWLNGIKNIQSIS
jgi:hypothetical protein